MQSDKPTTVVVSRSGSVLSTNAVLRNTYMLLSLTMLFSAGMAGLAMYVNAPPVTGIVWLVLFLGLSMVVGALRNSVWGLVAIFALTGFLGWSLGPVFSYYIRAFSNGSQLVMTALGGTGVIFLALSGYALTTRKDFNYLFGFLMVGSLVAMLAVLGGLFFNIPGLHLAISAIFILIFSGYILFDTSRIIHGGETNYITATVSLYLDIYMLLVNLLQILGIFGGRD